MPTAVIAAVGLLLILATTALNRGGEADASAGAPKGSAAEPVKVTSVDGERVGVPSKRPTVLYFMASWCYTCVPQAEAMKELEADYAGKADFVAIDVTPENTKDQVNQFRALAGSPGHPHVVDTTGQLTQNTRSLPWIPQWSSGPAVRSSAAPIQSR